MWDVVITTADKRTFRCPAANTGQNFLAMLGVPSVTLSKAIPLNNGTIHRCFRFIGPQTEHVDLSEYQDVFTADKQWFSRIAPVEECMP